VAHFSIDGARQLAGPGPVMADSSKPGGPRVAQIRANLRQAKLKPDAYVRAVELSCKKRGLRLTPQRAQVLRMVVEAGKPIKAYDVLSAMIEANGDTAPITAYRALGYLVEHGFIHRLASLSAYVACSCPGHNHAVPFLICESCDGVFEVTDERIVVLLTALAKARGFQTRAQTLEVQGTCAVCRDSATH
jgi:Fur family zinc uptake transcriptional regulator